MQLLIFGAGGKVGQLVVDEALRRNHGVTAFVHSSRLKERRNLIQITGDIYDRQSVEAAIRRPDTIISALGSWGTKKQNVLSSAMQNIIPAAEQRGVRRVVSLTGDLAQAPSDKPRLFRKLVHVGMIAVRPKILRDAEDHIALLARSKLDWTVLRSPVMTNKYDTQYVLSLKTGGLHVSRQAVAEALVDLAESSEWRRSAPFIHRV